MFDSGCWRWSGWLWRGRICWCRKHFRQDWVCIQLGRWVTNKIDSKACNSQLGILDSPSRCRMNVSNKLSNGMCFVCLWDLNPVMTITELHQNGNSISFIHHHISLRSRWRRDGHELAVACRQTAREIWSIPLESISIDEAKIGRFMPRDVILRMDVFHALPVMAELVGCEDTSEAWRDCDGECGWAANEKSRCWVLFDRWLLFGSLKVLVSLLVGWEVARVRAIVWNSAISVCWKLIIGFGEEFALEGSKNSLCKHMQIS